MDINSAKMVIEAAAMADDTVIMEGLHGIGKSEIVKQFSRENGYHLEELFLSHQEVGDLIGIPKIVEMDGEFITAWSKPIWFQRMEKAAKEGLHCVLFLDELNRAPIDVRQSALQLVLERKIHEHELPSVKGQRTLVVAAINPSDAYQVDELDDALLDRFCHITVEADAPAWLAWAQKTGVNPMVRNFIAEYPDRIHWMPEDGGIGATPRSWTKLADFIDKIEQIPREIHFQIFKGKVGSELGSQFLTFMNTYQDVIKMGDIEDLVGAKSETITDIEKLGEEVAVLMEKTESIQKKEMCSNIVAKYIVGESSDALPMMAYLYSLPIEVLASYLKSYKETNAAEYAKIAEIDLAVNQKGLFKRIVGNIRI